MDRQTRKANLKKLQLPGSTGNKQQQRKTRQTAKAPGSTAITNYFQTPEKCSKDQVVVEDEEKAEIQPKGSAVVLEFDKPNEELAPTSKSPTKPATRKRLKRTKLDNFIFKDPNDMPDSVKTSKSPPNDEDFVVPEKKVKKAPKLTLSSSQAKATKTRKKQTTIKSAFLRNEQLFAEIAAQHCAADQFDGDDVQLALAISRSEAESKGIKLAKENDGEDEVNLIEGNNSAELIREKLKKYGFRTAEKNDYNTFAAAFLPKANGRRPKSKWANKFTALTLRTSEKQLKKLQENIEKLLNSQFRTKTLSEEESLQPHYKLQSSLLKKLNMHENNKILQCKENVNQSIDRYFVKELFEISDLPAGHLLKDWTAIQGRDLTPNRRNKPTKETLQKLQNIYKDLEEYFTSRKRLDWTMENENKGEQELPLNKDITDKKEKEPKVKAETSKSSNLEENESMEDIAESNTANTTCNAKILKLLPPARSLGVMQVSSCSINTQATINSTQREESVVQSEFSNEIVEHFEESNNVELDKMVELIEDMQANESVIYCKATKICENNISKTSQTPTSLETSQKEEFVAQSKHSENTIEISDDSNNVELDEMVALIENMHRNEAELENTEKVDDLKPSPTTTSMQATQVSCKSNQTPISATQNTRSNSPDLFADSDVEMEECDKEEEVNKTEVPTVINVVKDKSRNSSIENVDEGVTTYEIFSSDEVKNTSLLELNKATKKAPSIPNIPPHCDDHIIDLTQYDLSPSPQNETNYNLNQSKPIVEIDLFAESPIQEDDIDFSPTQNKKEDKEHDLADINKNSQISKYLQESKDESLKFSLRMKTNEEEFNEKKGTAISKETTFLENKSLEESFKLSLITEAKFRENKSKEESFKFSLETSENEDEIEKNQSEESLKFTLEISDNEEFVLKEKSNEESFKLCLEVSDKEEEIFEKNNTEESFKLSLSLNTQEPLREFAANKEPYQDDDIVLREMAMDETNTSFLNFQGSKQLETCFHKEMATAKEKEHFNNNTKDKGNKEKELLKDSLTANDTMFRELCNKYLNDPQNSAKELQKTDFNKTKSFTQILPAIKTPEKYDNYTNFTMDFDMSVTIDNELKLKRKSSSFTCKTPPKFLRKSQSFNKSKLENLSIDLTQNEAEDNKEDLEPEADEEEEEDDCLVLSDDEINYSIWQANKTGNFHTSEISEQEEDDVISLTDNENASDEDSKDSNKEQIIEFPNRTGDIKNSLFLDLKDKEKSSIKVASIAEESYSDFGELSSKYSAPKTPPLHEDDDMKFDRSDFGILEEYSEPMDYTANLCTPTKVLKEASFLSSPTETTAPMKRYSSCHKSSQKFQELINNLETKSPTNDFKEFEDKTPMVDRNDFDEFDRLVYTSPLKSLGSAKKTPQGMDRLLTAEISFKESQKSPVREVTPSEQIITCNNKTYSVRYTSSPKPDYTKFSEAELLKELYNLGIKPLKRKQAVKMLEYIYNQTHPILMEDDDEVVQEKFPQEEDVITLDDLERPSTSKEALKTKKSVTKTREKSDKLSNESPREVVENLLDVGSKKLNLQDSCGREMLRYSLDLKAELLDEQYILQTNVTKKTPQPLLPFHIAWYNLVCSNPKLHETILMYEPIDLQEIYLFLKSLGYRYDPKDLKIFFDRRCIIFRYDLTSSAAGKTKDSNRHVRKKSKKTKTIKK